MPRFAPEDEREQRIIERAEIILKDRYDRRLKNSKNPEIWAYLKKQRQADMLSRQITYFESELAIGS